MNENSRTRQIREWTFLQLAETVLREAGQPLTPTEIWQFAKERGYDKKTGSRGKTPERTLGVELQRDLIINAEKTSFESQGFRPTKWTLKGLKPHPGTDDKSAREARNKAKIDPAFLEKDLRPFLAYISQAQFKAFLRPIRESTSVRSRSKGEKEWLHPDMVGCSFSFKAWATEVAEVANAYAVNRIKLYSFELKRELSFETEVHPMDWTWSPI